MKIAALILVVSLELGVQHLGVVTVVDGVGGHRHHPFGELLTAELEKIRRNKGPGGCPGNLEPDLLHAFRDLDSRRRQRIGDYEINVGILQFCQLRCHVGVVLIEHLGAGGHGHARSLEQTQRRLAAALAPAGRVMHKPQPPIALLLDVLDYERSLDTVIERGAEDVALRRAHMALDDRL